MAKNRRGQRAKPRQGDVGNPDVDFVKLGIQPQDVPKINAMIKKVEETTDGSSPLNQGEAKELAEILDKAISPGNLSKNSEVKFSEILRRVSHFHNILPASYYARNVELVEKYALGGFADIYRGKYEGRSVRIKAFRVQTAKNIELIKHRLYPEIARWKYISHPNLLPFVGISETPPAFCIIGPWMPNGDIIEYTEKNQNVNRLLLLAQSAGGLDHLHSLDIVHGTLNPGNILITGDGVACLADYAISGLIANPTFGGSGTMAASKRQLLYYTAPEQIRPSNFNRTSNDASKESDVHWFAMTAYEVLTRIQLYTENERPGPIIKRILDGERPPRPSQEIVGPWLPDAIWEMIESCWALYPWSRPRIAEAHQTLLHSADDLKNARIGKTRPSHPPPPKPQGSGDTIRANPQSPWEESDEWQTVQTKRSRLRRPNGQGLDEPSPRQPHDSDLPVKSRTNKGVITQQPSTKPRDAEGPKEKSEERKAEGAGRRGQEKEVEAAPSTTKKASKEVSRPLEKTTVMTATKETTKDGTLKPSERTATETFKREGSKLESTAVAAVPTKATQGPSSITRESLPGSGDATSPGSPAYVKQPPMLTRLPSKKVSRKPSVQDTRQEGGGGVPTRDVQIPPPLQPLPPPTMGRDDHPSYKATQAIGGGTTDESPSKPPLSTDNRGSPGDSSTAEGVIKPEPPTGQKDTRGHGKPEKRREVVSENTSVDPLRTEVAHVVPPVPQKPSLGTGDGTHVGGMVNGVNNPFPPPPLPPTNGGNEHPNHKAIGGGTIDESPPLSSVDYSNPPEGSSTAGDVTKREPSNRRRGARGSENPDKGREVVPGNTTADLFSANITLPPPPPPPRPWWKKYLCPCLFPPPPPRPMWKNNFTSYPPQPTRGSAAEDLAYYFHPSTHWDRPWYDEEPRIPPPAMLKGDRCIISGRTIRRGSFERRVLLYGVFCRDLSVFWGELKVENDGSGSSDPNRIGRSARFLPCPQPLGKEALVEAHNTYGDGIASLAERHIEAQQYCGRGECWDFASNGLKQEFDRAERPIPSISRTHGHLIVSFNVVTRGDPIGMWRGGDDRVRRGDIVEWRSVKIRVKTSRGHGTATLGDPDHTAIVVSDLVPGCPVENGKWLEVAKFGTLEVAEQSKSTDVLPKKGKYDFSGLEQGEVWVYRPIGMKEYIGTEFSNECPEDIETRSI